MAGTLTRWPIRNGEWIVGDTFDAMATIPSGSVDMILADLPYGTTQNKWDSVLPLDRLWREYWRIAKPNAAIVLTAAQPFTTVLIASQIERFKYCWVWRKTQAVGHLNAWRQPMRNSEDIAVFCKNAPLYFPQLTNKPKENQRPQTTRTSKTDNYGSHGLDVFKCPPDKSMPATILTFANAQGVPHPTAKPPALFEYLIRTYTKPGDTVLDNTAGSGTTAIAAEQSDRRWICIERDLTYSLAALDRIARHANTD